MEIFRELISFPDIPEGIDDCQVVELPALVQLYGHQDKMIETAFLSFQRDEWLKLQYKKKMGRV